MEELPLAPSCWRLGPGLVVCPGEEEEQRKKKKKRRRRSVVPTLTSQRPTRRHRRMMTPGDADDVDTRGVLWEMVLLDTPAVLTSAVLLCPAPGPRHKRTQLQRSGSLGTGRTSLREMRAGTTSGF